MRKILIVFILIGSALSMQISSQAVNPSNPIEQALASEYQSLLIENITMKSNLRAQRLVEIEKLSLQYNFFVLREFIAQSFFWQQPHRENQAPKEAYKFLKPNLQNNWFSSTPLAFYFASMTEYEDDLKKLLEIKFEETNYEGLGRSLGLMYLNDKSELKKAESLLPIYKRFLGVQLDLNLTIVSVEYTSAADFLEAGDQLLKINNSSLKKIEDISFELSKYEDGSIQEITFKRNNLTVQEKFSIPKKKIILSNSAFNAFWYLLSDDLDGAKELAREAIDTYDTKTSYGQNERFLEIELAGNKYVLCAAYLQPINKNLEQRMQGLHYCEEALEVYERLFGNPQLTDYFTTNKNIIQADPFHANIYNNLLKILSRSYLKDRLNYGLGAEIKRINPQTSLDLLERNPLLQGQPHKQIVYAVANIYLNGRQDDFKNQFESLSLDIIDILESLSTLESAEGKTSRFYLQAIYNYSSIHKDYKKGLAVRLSSYELDQSPLPIIRLALSHTYGYGIEKSDTKTQKLLEELFDKYGEEELKKYYKYDKYLMSWAYNQLSYLYFAQQDYLKAFNLIKNKLGTNQKVDLLISSLVIDSQVNVSKEYLDKVLETQKAKDLIDELNLEEYIAFKFDNGIEPFYENKDRACKGIGDSNKKITNIGKQLTWLCSDFNISENSIAKEYLVELSNNGSSLASSGLAFYFSQEEDIKNLELAQSYASKAKTQLDSNSSYKLNENISWLLDTTAFDVRADSLLSISEDINQSIERYNNYQLALKNAQIEKEKKKIELSRKKEQESLARLRAQKRNEALKKGGNFLFDVLEFTVKVALVVGAVALAGEALEDSSPEVKRAFVDSLSSSVSGSDYSSKSSSYQCQNARNKLARGRTQFNTSRSLIGNMSCNNVGPSCLTPLPTQCRNQAYSCRAGDYNCTSRGNTNFFNCQQRARQAAQNKKASCENFKRQAQNQCNNRVDNNQRSSAQNNINAAQREINLYCY
jgi:hypothetical protein